MKSKEMREKKLARNPTEKKIVTITRKQFDLYFPSTDFTAVILCKHSEV
jgi:hypothetical protein